MQKPSTPPPGTSGVTRPEPSNNPFYDQGGWIYPQHVIDAGVAALGSGMSDTERAAFKPMLERDVRAVLNAVGHPHQTSAEIDRLKAQLASAHETLRAARSELRGLYNDRRKAQQTPAAAPDDDSSRAAAGPHWLQQVADQLSVGKS